MERVCVGKPSGITGEAPPAADKASLFRGRAVKAAMPRRQISFRFMGTSDELTARDSGSAESAEIVPGRGKRPAAQPQPIDSEVP